MKTLIITFFIGVLAIVLFRFMYTHYEYFSSPVACTFKTLGKYKLSTDKSIVSSSTSKGLIYISSISDWKNISYTKESDLIYSYTDFTPTDLNNRNVKSTINKLMTCNNIPEFSNAIGVNSNAALILCLQSDTRPGSRVFFVKSFVPISTSATDRNAIVGEIGDSTVQVYSGSVQPVAVIQGAIGTPNITDIYTLSYTICSAASRPVGFRYTDCCSNISNTAAVVSVNMLPADTQKDGKECEYPSANIVSSDNTNTIDKLRTGLHDPGCKRGSYSKVTGGECTGTVDTSEYKTLSSVGDIKYKDYDYNILRSKYDKWFDRHNKNPSGTDLNDWLSDNVTDSSTISPPIGTITDNTPSSDLYSLSNETLGDDSISHSNSSLSQRDIAILKKLASDKATPNEHSWPQKYGDVNKSSDATMKPGLSECKKYYNCKKYDESCDDNCDDYEAQC